MKTVPPDSANLERTPVPWRYSRSDPSQQYRLQRFLSRLDAQGNDWSTVSGPDSMVVYVTIPSPHCTSRTKDGR